jgi:putative FmdB family regulatory protein
MPTYSYKCKSCAHAFDVQQSFSDAALTKCPNCSGELVKVFGNVGVTFKGSGFYRNDKGTSSGSTAAKD